MRALHGWRRICGLMVACAFALGLLAAPAPAADFVIDGSPLNIYANDSGQLQVAFDGSASGEFFPGTLAPASAGVSVALSTSPPPLTVYGFLNPLHPLVADPNRPPSQTGDGSAGNPFKLTINLTDGAFLHLEQTLTYINGTTDVGVRFALQAFDNAVTGRLYEAADLYVSGDDRGVGFVEPGPPLQVGGVNQAAGSSARLIQGTPAWDHYQESFYDNVFSVIRGTTDVSAPNLSDTVNPALGDNDLGVQWNFSGISSNPPGPGQTYSTTWRFKHFAPLALSLAASTRAQGQTATVTVAAQNGDGNPDPGRTIRYAISGANPSLGTVTTGANGNATISWVGENQGVDTLSAFTDLNGNGRLDAGEPTQSVTVTWGSPLPPVPGKSVVVKVVSGTVFVKYPPGYVPRAVVPAKGFVPFKGAANVPIGTQFDTKRGRVALTSAADTGGKKTQTSDFYAGIFAVKQALPKKKSNKAVALITDLVLKGQTRRSECAPLKGASAAAVDAKKKKKGPKSLLGKLWGNGKGKFRTTGKYSSATVRGTIWLTEDRCDGTLTTVRRGTVRVFDRKRKKTVTVKAPHSYLARAQRVTSKRHA
jgi:hypothetical protein